MFCDTVSFTSAELNSGVIVSKLITDRTLQTTDAQLREYRPSACKIKNSNAATVYVGLMDTAEYNWWIQAPVTRSDLIPVDANESEILNNLKFESAYAVVSGIVGTTYSGQVQFILLQD